MSDKFVWEIQFDEHWSNTPKGEWEYSDIVYKVVAVEMVEAIGKAEKAAIGKQYEDETGAKHNLVDVRVREVKRGTELDAI
jgi:hypothetical protein